MKWLGYKQVQVKSLVVDAADIRKRTKAAHVAELASDIRARGEEPINAPTVRAGDKRLLCGRDRVAALISLKTKRAWVHLVDCDDTEAKEVELAENIYRRADNRAELIARMVTLKEQQYSAEHERAAAEGTTVSRAPQHSPKALARKDVARAAGVSTAAVKQDEARSQKRAKAAKIPPPDGASAPVSAEPDGRGEAPPSAEVSIDLLGCDDEGGRAIAEMARKDQEAIDEADKHLRLAQAALKRITLNALQQQLYADVHRVASRVRSHRPEFLCPWCKGLPALVTDCQPCQGIGFVSHETAGRAPREVLNAEAPVVLVHGQFVPYADAKAGKLPKNGAPAKKPGKKQIRVEDEAGNEIPLDADEAY